MSVPSVPSLGVGIWSAHEVLIESIPQIECAGLNHGRQLDKRVVVERALEQRDVAIRNVMFHLHWGVDVLLMHVLHNINACNNAVPDKIKNGMAVHVTLINGAIRVWSEMVATAEIVSGISRWQFLLGNICFRVATHFWDACESTRIRRPVLMCVTLVSHCTSLCV